MTRMKIFLDLSKKEIVRYHQLCTKPATYIYTSWKPFFMNFENIITVWMLLLLWLHWQLFLTHRLKWKQSLDIIHYKASYLYFLKKPSMNFENIITEGTGCTKSSSCVRDQKLFDMLSMTYVNFKSNQNACRLKIK